MAYLAANTAKPHSARFVVFLARRLVSTEYKLDVGIPASSGALEELDEFEVGIPSLR